MNDFLTIFYLNTQEIWKEIFKKYESLTWDSFFQITSIFAVFPIPLIIKYLCIIFYIDYSQPLSQQDVLMILKEISSDSFYKSVEKDEKIEYPIHFNSLLQFLSLQKHSYDKLIKIRQNIRNGLLSDEKFQEISERPNYMVKREEYESQYRQLPPNPCCYKILHCGKDHPIRLHYDFETPSYNRQNVITRFLENVLVVFNPSSIKTLKSNLTFYSIPKSRSCRNSYNNPNNNNIPTSPVSSERDAVLRYNTNRKKSGASSTMGNRNSSGSNFGMNNTNNGNGNGSSSNMVNKYLQSQAQIQMQQHQQQQQQHHHHHNHQYIGTPKALGSGGSSLKKSINSQKNSVNVSIDINNVNNFNFNNCSSTRSRIKRNSVGAMYSNLSTNATTTSTNAVVNGGNGNGNGNGFTSPFIKSQRVIHSCKNSVNSSSNKDNTLINSPLEFKRNDFSPNDNNISLYNRQMMNIGSKKNKISPLIPPRPPPAVPDFS